jgi:hypothetical protein
VQQEASPGQVSATIRSTQVPSIARLPITRNNDGPERGQNRRISFSCKEQKLFCQFLFFRISGGLNCQTVPLLAENATELPSEGDQEQARILAGGRTEGLSFATVAAKGVQEQACSAGLQPWPPS